MEYHLCCNLSDNCWEVWNSDGHIVYSGGLLEAVKRLDELNKAVQ